MSNETTSELAGAVQVTHLKGGGLQLVRADDAPTRAARYECWVLHLPEARDQMTAGAWLLLCLVANEAVLTLDGLRAATGVGTQIYHDPEGVWLEWQHEAGWRDRRSLSYMTLMAIGAVGERSISSADWSSAVAWLRRWYSMAKVWSWMLGDALAWWGERLPGPLALHCSRLAPMQPLPRSALARRAACTPLAAGLPVGGQQRRAACVSGSRPFIDAPSAALSKAVGFVRTAARRRQAPGHLIGTLRGQLTGLLPVAAEEGSSVLLVLEAMLEVLEVGGIRGRALSLRSLAEYLRHSCKPLIAALHGADLLELEGWRKREVFLDLKQAAPPTQRAKVVAFLLVLERHLVAAGGDPMPLPLVHGQPPVPPLAQIVWKHELALIETVVADLRTDERTRAQCLVGLSLAAVIPIRISELWDLRLTDLRLHAGGLSVSIAPRAADGADKSPHTHRTVDIIDSAAVQRVNSFLQRRRLEHALESDFLFGDPWDHRARYRERETTELMNLVLRQVTGDPRVSFHDLRRVCISPKAERLLSPRKDSRIDQLELQGLSGFAGHVGPTSTLSYMHLFELPLAEYSRLLRPGAWAMEFNSSAHFSAVEDGFEFSSYMPQSVCLDAAGTDQPASVSLALNILADLAHGMEDDSAALRAGVSEGVVDAVARGCASLLEQVVRDSACIRGPQSDRLAIERHIEWFRSAKQAKYCDLGVVLEEMADRDRDEAHALVRSWLASLRGEDVCLDRPSVAGPLVSLIKASSIPFDHLLVTRAAEDNQPLRELGLGRVIERTVRARRGRADARLHVCTGSATLAKIGTRETSMAGLHGWLVATAATLNMPVRGGRK